MKEVKTMEQILKRKAVKRPVRFLEKRILNFIYKPFVEWYTSRESNYKYQDVALKIKPGVFHPRFFSSTSFMLEFLEFMNFSKKKVIEIGSGSGLISIVAAKEGANVTAVDICPLAIENTKLNVSLNSEIINDYPGSVEVFESDLFGNVKTGVFDILIVNPPFYPGVARKPSDHAWYAGKDFEYFQKLFVQCKEHMDSSSEMYMVLSEDCNFTKIFGLAKENSLTIKAVSVKQFLTENLYIFKITV
ncbi:MAG: methyltransferase [Bacteroidetes bacterium]|nr:methyltransferase [Bacteroidota bacterium]